MLMAAPIFIVVLGILYLQSRYLIHQEAVESTTSLLNTTLQRVINYVGTVETGAKSNVWMIEEKFDEDRMLAVSRRIVDLNRNVVSSSIFVVPGALPNHPKQYSVYSVNAGDTIITSSEPEYDYLDRLCYTKPLETGKACWVDPFIDFTESRVDHNQAIATYSMPIRMANGRIAGIVAVDLSFSNMAKIINDVESPYDNSYYILVSSDGRYLIHPDSTRLFSKTIFSDVDPAMGADLITLGHEMTAGKQGSLEIYLHNTKHHVCYTPVPNTDWSLAIVCPENDVMYGFSTIGYLMVAIIIIGLLLIIWLVDRIVKETLSPIGRLLENTQHLAEGNYDEQIPEAKGKGVLARMQNSFAKMQNALNSRMGTLRRNADEIRQHNDELAKSQQQADETVRRKNLFMQHVAQQMRMPLNVITGFANVLLESSDNREAIDAEQLSSIASMMKSNAVNLNLMVVMLFDASEPESAEVMKCSRKDEVACNGFAQECIRHTVSHFPNANIRFTSEVPDSFVILTNQLYLMRTLRELLYNAAKYTDGTNIKLMITQTDTKVRFTVQDVGPGLTIDADELIFKPFVREGDLSEGLGLGLPLAKRHAKSLGGDLVFDSEYHEGCRVTIELPK
jgi:signal transduction histidine kinase